ncbi:MAG TPA: hypothetical protein VLA66_05215 [Thermoanaerobaculia bacterium]|nr:hypothetical protein [Thermoanaerobaculia bacterium]
MARRIAPLAALTAVALVAGLSSPLRAQEEKLPSQSTIAELVTVTGEVLAVDPAERYVTLLGPLGGEITGRVADDVKNLDQVEVGDLLTIGFYYSMALSATVEGQANPLFTGGEAATATEGEKPGAYVSRQVKSTVSVVSVDPEARTIVFQGEDGTLFPVEVERPEFARKLQTIAIGDKIDVVTTEALIVDVSPAAPGEKPSIGREMATLIIDRGEVVRRVNNTLIIRNEKGRTIKVTVDPAFKFKIDGKDATVSDLEPGMKLTRTALRVVESDYFQAE